MKKKLLIVLGAFALYGIGFLCAALDRGEAAERTAGIRGVTLEQVV